MRNFENWETQDLEIEFGLNQVPKMSLLDAWLSTPNCVLSEYELTRMEYLREKLNDNIAFWNEDELKIHFLSLIFLTVEFETANTRSFSKRFFKASFNNSEIGGNIDFLVAKGKQKPISPYFFICNYRQKSKKGIYDPKGQLIAKLFAVQQHSMVNFPLYGCYVVDKHWFFVVLNGKEYAVSNAFNASDVEIYQIIAILREVKTYIQQFMNQ